MNKDTFHKLHEQFIASGIFDAINFEQMNEILISHHSTSIEGSSLTEDETRMLLSEGLTAKGKPLLDHTMVQDHHRALLFILERAKGKEQLSVELLQRVSAMVLKTTGSVINSLAGTYNSAEGDFRKSAVYVGKRYFMDFRKVPDAVKSLCDDINAQNDAVKTVDEIYNLAFDAHFSFVGIHPFADGNGRVARLIMNYILAFHNQPPALVFTEDKQQYFDALEKSRETDNIQEIRDFLYSQQEKYFMQELDKFRQEPKIRLCGCCF
ncbi:MAG: Fic family protein, partial [Tannerella sp.]|nr:Fic family protein [Tannerella sp.]